MVYKGPPHRGESCVKRGRGPWQQQCGKARLAVPRFEVPLARTGRAGPWVIFYAVCSAARAATEGHERARFYCNWFVFIVL